MYDQLSQADFIFIIDILLKPYEMKNQYKNNLTHQDQYGYPSSECPNIATFKTMHYHMHHQLKTSLGVLYLQVMHYLVLKNSDVDFIQLLPSLRILQLIY